MRSNGWRGYFESSESNNFKGVLAVAIESLWFNSGTGFEIGEIRVLAGEGCIELRGHLHPFRIVPRSNPTRSDLDHIFFVRSAQQPTSQIGVGVA